MKWYYNRAYVGGTFDIFHPGHVALLRKTAARASYVTASLNTDEFVKEYKGAPPVMTLQERLEVVGSCRYVDNVVVNTGGADSKPAILRARPDVIVHGTDWVGDSLMKQMGLTQEFMDEHGISFLYIPVLLDGEEKVSASEIKERIYKRAEQTILGIAESLELETC